MMRVGLGLLTVTTFVPSCIIIVFGILSLYFSVVLTDEHRVQRTERQHVFQRMNDLNDTLHMLRDSEQRVLPTLTLLHSLNGGVAWLKSFEAKANHVGQAYDVALENLHTTVNTAIARLAALPQDALLETHDIQDNIGRDINALNRAALSQFEHHIASHDNQWMEIYLYWSILAMGASGVFLIGLNAHKIHKLRFMDIDKNKTLSALQSRMAALDMAQDGVVITDHADNVVYVNPSLLAIVGHRNIRPDDYTGKPWRMLLSDEDAAVFVKAVLPVIQDDAGNGHWSGDFLINRFDSTNVATQISVTRLEQDAMIITMHDVSRQKKAEQDLIDSESRYYQAQKMEAIGRLAGGIAHDFNNILASMNGYAEFLIDDLDRETQQHQFAQNILKAGEQARALVDQMLTFSRRDSNENQIFDVAATLQENLSMLSVTMPRSIDLHHDLLLEESTVEGNATQVAQLFMNLCVNAIDAMEKSHGRLMVNLTHLDPQVLEADGMVRQQLPDIAAQPFLKIKSMTETRSRLVLGHVSTTHRYVKIYIADTGMGMSRHVMEHIFEPFFTTKSVDKGTGLGLATVHGVIISHRGAMVIDSEEGLGTSFAIYLPLVEKDGDSAFGHGLSGIAVDHAVKEDDAAPHILVVEDQSAVRDIMERALERLGYEVSIAVDGMAGLDMIRENPTLYDLVITDYNMPQMTGLEMMDEIHADLPHLPFIVATGYSDDKTEALETHRAVKAVLRKPIAKDELALTVQDVLLFKGRQRS